MKQKTESFFQKTIVVWVGALICSALWGSAFPCIKIGYGLFSIAPSDTPSQLLFAGIRFTVAGFLAVILGSVMNGRFIYPKKTSWGMVLRLSCLQTILQYIFFYVGLAHTTGVRGSIIEGMNVFAAILIASLLFRQEKLTGRKIVGSIIGFTGVVLVNLSGGDAGSGSYFFGDLCVLLSTVAYAFSSVYVKRCSRIEDPVVLSGYQFIAGGIVMTALGIILGGHMYTVTLQGVLLLVYMAFISAVAYSLWGILLKYNPVSRVTVFGFMNPVFGVILSAILLSEASSLGLFSLISLVLVCAGIYIVNREES